MWEITTAATKRRIYEHKRCKKLIKQFQKRYFIKLK